MCNIGLEKCSQRLLCLKFDPLPCNESFFFLTHEKLEETFEYTKKKTPINCSKQKQEESSDPEVSHVGSN